MAFAVANMQIEADATFSGHPLDVHNHRFIELYQQEFPQYYAKYTGRADEILVHFQPTRITLYKYIDGEPCKDILDIPHKAAYRTHI